MDVSVQESIITPITLHGGKFFTYVLLGTISFLILEHTDSEEESGQVQQDNINIGMLCFFMIYPSDLFTIFILFFHLEQVELSNIAPQDLESEGKIISFSM